MTAAVKQKLTILFEDDDLVLVNKPPQLLTIPDRYDAEKPSVFQWLTNQYGKIFTVHRLDKPTSGILCFAKTEAAHAELNRQFREREVSKIYYALVDGIPHPTAGIIDQGIAPHPTKPGQMMVTNRGKKSVTHYKTVESFGNASLVEADLKTGRTHQIRVHFAAIGHPLLVDELYGTRAAFFLSELKLRRFRLGKDQEERPLMTRTSLHAFRLELTHPATRKRLIYEAPLPKDFGAVVKQLRKWSK